MGKFYSSGPHYGNREVLTGTLKWCGKGSSGEAGKACVTETKPMENFAGSYYKQRLSRDH